MPGWDLVSHFTTAARNGLTNVNIATGEDRFSGVGTALLRPREGRSNIVMAWASTAAIANLYGWRLHRALDPNWMEGGIAAASAFFGKDQTGVCGVDRLAFCNYPVDSSDQIIAQINNNNNAQYDGVHYALAHGMSPKLGVQPRDTLPEGCFWVYGVGAATMVAGTWSPWTPTFSATFDQNAEYEVHGMAGWSATSHALRLKYTSGEWAKYSPGVPAGDTGLLHHVLYGDFGRFPGNMTPTFLHLSTAGDTAEYAGLLVRKVG